VRVQNITGNAYGDTDVFSSTAHPGARPAHPASEEAPMPDLALTAAAARADRDCFRDAVLALPPGPLRDVLTAVAYARDAAARGGSSAAPEDRWQALVAVAERAVQDAAADFTLRLVAA
jgi:hypothetical protein